MKKLCLPQLFLAFFIIKTNLYSQIKPKEKLVASTLMVFIDGEEKGEYACSIKVEKGILKVGHKIDAYGADGLKFTFEVKDISVDDRKVTETGPTSYAFVGLKSAGKSKGFDQGFNIVGFGEKIGDSSNLAATQIKNIDIKAEASCLIDGKNWAGNGYANSHLYYTKGVKLMDTNKPYLLLAFSSTLPPDDRQLTLTFHDFKGNLGKYNKEKIEILLSGSADGNKKAPTLQGHKMPSMSSDFII